MVVGVLRSSEVIKVLNDILQGFSDTDSYSQTKRRKLIEAVFKALRKTKIASQHAECIVNRIVLDFPRCDKTHLLKLVEYCISCIRSNDDDSMRLFINQILTLPTLLIVNIVFVSHFVITI